MLASDALDGPDASLISLPILNCRSASVGTAFAELSKVVFVVAGVSVAAGPSLLTPCVTVVRKFPFRLPKIGLAKGIGELEVKTGRSAFVLLADAGVDWGGASGSLTDSNPVCASISLLWIISAP
jgi:hypothetical protein